MQDVKHLTNKRKGLLRQFLSRRGSRQSVRNRRLAESAVKKDLRLRFILPAFALVLAAWPVYSLLP
ncbi:MAG TPA: penicillin-binding protein, partial [Geobacteraceae bacterium]|nr:penicillin-binding protein [Geobacteraceae bacterium]